jgi:metal-responsive CopG/Arc/MetJ family transcriptional regulator
MTRHNLSISDELWAEVQQAAIDEAARTRKTMSVSEWIRVAIRQRLDELNRAA